MNEYNELLKHHKSPAFLLKNYEIIAYNDAFKLFYPKITEKNDIRLIFNIEDEEIKNGSKRISKKNNKEENYKLFFSDFDKQIADFFVTINKYEEQINEAQISNTEKNFFNFYNKIIDPILIIQLDGKIVSSNITAKTFAKLYKIDLKKELYINDLEIFNNIGHILLDPKNFGIKKTLKTIFKQKTTLYFEYIIQPLLFNRKKALAIIFKDITENKKLIHKLASSKEKYKKILNSLFDGIILTEDEIIEFWNKSAEKITGYTKKEVLGKPIFSIFKKEVEELLKLEQINNLSENSEELCFVKKMLTKNGKEIIVDISISNIIDDNGTKKTIGVFKDITEKYLTNKKVKNKEEELKNVNSALKSFFSILAHDMRTPTIQMMGLSELIAENITKFSLEEIKKYVLMLQLSSKNSLELLDTLVEWGKTMTNKTPNNPKSFKIHDTIEKVLRLNQSNFESKEIEYEYESNKLKVFADPNMVFPIFNNLISNALKFSYKNSKIIIKTIEFADSIQISVQDFGIGINDIESIFKYNKKTIVLGTEDEKGKGIGLMFTAELVKKNNGKIWVKSEPKKGSTFYFSLPKG